VRPRFCWTGKVGGQKSEEWKEREVRYAQLQGEGKSGKSRRIRGIRDRVKKGGGRKGASMEGELKRYWQHHREGSASDQSGRGHWSEDKQ